MHQSLHSIRTHTCKFADTASESGQRMFVPDFINCTGYKIYFLMIANLKWIYKHRFPSVMLLDIGMQELPGSTKFIDFNNFQDASTEIDCRIVIIGG